MKTFIVLTSNGSIGKLFINDDVTLDHIFENSIEFKIEVKDSNGMPMVIKDSIVEILDEV